MLEWAAKHVFFPLWELKTGGKRRSYLAELERSQWQRPEDVRSAQWRGLEVLVRDAFKNVPYYQGRYGSLGFDGKLSSWAGFEALPLLTKGEVRENVQTMLSPDIGANELVEARTGGSTGTALTLYFDKACQQRRNAAAMRSDAWAGRVFGMKVAGIWGNPPKIEGIRDKVRNALLDRTIYLDTMDIREQSVGDFVLRWRRERPQIVLGHSHSIYMVAKYLRELGVTNLRPKGIISTSMMLLANERKVIEDVFECLVTDRYGCEEVGLIASECEMHCGMHVNAEHVVVEVLRDDGRPAALGEPGNVVVTDLTNRAMPLIRYVVGDMAVASGKTCGCGRGLPLLERLVGRRADFLKRRDGSLVAGVSLVERTLTAIPGIDQMQIVQDELAALSVRVVGKAVTYESEQALVGQLAAVFGTGVEISVRRVAELDKTPAGKYRFSICNV